MKFERDIAGIAELSADEREELLVSLAFALEGTAREARVEGNQQFAALSQGMAEAIRVNADELAYEAVSEAGRVADEASKMLAKFRSEHPHPVVSYAIN
jgi:hypothetical protein